MSDRLDAAYDRYWRCKSLDDQRSVEFEIMLYGGENPWSKGRFRDWVARQLRRLAEWIDR